MTTKKEEYYRIAKKILNEVGAIAECDCEGMYRRGRSYENAYQYATNRFKEECKDKKCDMKLFHEVVKEILDEALPSDEKCPICEG